MQRKTQKKRKVIRPQKKKKKKKNPAPKQWAEKEIETENHPPTCYNVHALCLACSEATSLARE